MAKRAPTGGIRAAVESQLASLSPTMRTLLGVIVVMFGLMWIGLVLFVVNSSLSASAAGVRTAKTQLSQIQSLHADYVDAQNRIAAAEAQFEKVDGGKPTGFIEKKASEANVREMLRTVKEQDSTVEGSLRQTRFLVEVKNAPYGGALDFLYELETSGFMQVEQSEFRTAFVSGEKRVSLTLHLVVYQTEEAP